MQPTILLEGELFPEKLRDFMREVESYSVSPDFDHKKGIVVVLKSRGGNCLTTLETIRKIRELKFPLYAKIYEAESSAALIALAAKSAEIVKGGIFTIHLGSVRLEASDIGPNGRVPTELCEMLEILRDETISLLSQKCKQNDEYFKKKLSKLLASGSLSLTEFECIGYGIAERFI